MDSIWSSVEYDAISRGFNYTEYVDFHRKIECKGALVSVVAYSLIHISFYTQQLEDKIEDINE